jgi:hypothetical protein
VKALSSSPSTEKQNKTKQKHKGTTKYTQPERSPTTTQQVAAKKSHEAPLHNHLGLLGLDTDWPSDGEKHTPITQKTAPTCHSNRLGRKRQPHQVFCHCQKSSISCLVPKRTRGASSLEQHARAPSDTAAHNSNLSSWDPEEPTLNLLKIR